MYVSSISPLPKTKPKFPFRFIVGGGQGGQGGLLFFVGPGFWWVAVFNKPHNIEIQFFTFPKRYAGQNNSMLRNIKERVCKIKVSFLCAPPGVSPGGSASFNPNSNFYT